MFSSSFFCTLNGDLIEWIEMFRDLPTAGDIERDPDDELFGEEIGLIDWLFGGCDCAPGPDCCCCCDAPPTLFGGGGWWPLFELFGVELVLLFWAAAAASCCNYQKKWNI